MQRDALKKGRSFPLLSLASLPILIFYAVLFREMRDVPILDDYRTFLGFVLTLRELPSLGSKLLWVISAQNLAYKYPLENMLVAAQWAVTGRVSFIPIMVAGNLMVLGILWLLWKNYFAEERNFSRRILLFLPICFVFVQLNYGEALDWASSNMDYVPAIFFSFAALHLLLQDSRRCRLGACLCALLGYLCFPNAFLIAPIGFWLLLKRRRWKELATWSAAALFALVLCLFRYQQTAVAAQGNPATLAGKLVFFVSLSGAAVENMSRFPIRGGAIVVGGVLLLTFANSLRRRFYRSNPFAFYSTVWALATVAVITVGRSAPGISISLIPRYKFYSDLLLVYGYGFAVHRIDTVATPLRRKRLLYGATLAAAVCFAAGSDYFGYKFLAHRQQAVAQGLNAYAADPGRNVPMISMTGQAIPQAEPEQNRKILNEAIATGIYRLPPPERR